MTLHFNRSEHRQVRRQRRAEMPRAEVIIWSKLKNRQLLGCKFRRQYGIGPYDVDFYSAELKLAIELDGDSHYVDGMPRKDGQRQRIIEGFGIRVLRFLNTDVFENLDGVWEVMARVAKEQIEKLGLPIVSKRRGSRARGELPRRHRRASEGS